MSITTQVISDCCKAERNQAFSSKTAAVKVQTWCNQSLVLSEEGTHYGFLWKGEATLKRDRQTSPIPLQSGMYFSLAEPATISGQSSSGIVVTHTNHQGQFQLGGPVEPTGRLPYIDGGTTTLLIPPIAAGDPCFSALYMPKNVDQTIHEHPSDRIGIIIRGTGNCIAKNQAQQQHPLQPGILFHISAQQPHRFSTGPSGLDLVVFHPDSDMGVTHQNHPMLRRTIVEGISAANLPNLQTQL